jgi:hypothetical protein
LIAPNSTRLAFAPVIGTVACVLLTAQAARSVSVSPATRVGGLA